MSRMNAVFAALLLAATTALVTPASAVVTSKAAVAISGSSAVWQTLALAAYNQGGCPSAPVHHGTCQHYTDNTKFNLNDTRPTLVGGSTNVDPGDLWIVWDQPTTGTRNVWVFLKVDSIVGDRCFFAQPRCTITAPSGYVWTTLGSKISLPAPVWGADSVPPADVQSLFTTGVAVNTAATDIRPEDALFEQCRVNSALGNGVTGFGDGLDGLGYNAGNTSGTCPSYPSTLAKGVGTAIKSGIPGSSAQANVLAFNISGHDPFSNKTVSAGTVYDLGADPIVFVFSRSSTANSGNGLRGATDISDAQAQNIFSGANCGAGQITGTTGNDPIDAYLREPLSGTMTTTEMSVFRRPTKTIPPQGHYGVSQETGVGGVASLNKACTAGGNRIRGIGTGEVTNGNAGVGGVLNSGGAHNDGIAYAFFSFGNVSKLTGANYGYLTLDGEDPIGLGSPTHQLPTCSFPCTEAGAGWTAGNSFPALRSGNYSAWSLLRVVTSSAANTKALVSGSQTFVVNDTPDYIPALGVPLGCTGAACTDIGLQVFHTHYQQRNGNDATLGSGPSNGTFNANGNPLSNDKGGDAGGCTISTAGITTTTGKNMIQSNVTDPFTVTCTLARD